MKFQEQHLHLTVEREIQYAFQRKPFQNRLSQGRLNEAYIKTSRKDHNTRGLLQIVNFKGKIRKGYASLIAPRLAITAAHNIHNRYQHKPFTSLTFLSLSPGMAKQKVTNTWFPRAYMKTNHEDYGLIELQTSIDGVGHGELTVFEHLDQCEISDHCYDYAAFSQDRFNGLIRRVLKDSKWIHSHLDYLKLIGHQLFSITPLFVGQFEIAKVRSIDFSWSRIGQQGLKYLVLAVMWPQLQSLVIKNNEIGPGGAKYLTLASWPKLKYLNLNNNAIGAEGACLLSKASWPLLENIRLRSNQIGAVGAAHLSRANWPGLKNINLSSNDIGPRGAAHLSKANWPSLKSIQLWRNKIKDVKQIGRAHWPLLQSINLSSNEIGPEGARHFEKTNWPHLRMIDLWSNLIGPEGTKHLVRAIWPQLKSIDLRGNAIGPEGSWHIGVSNWPLLQNINLSSNRIGQQGAKHLSKANWPQIKIVNLSGNNVTNTFIKQNNWPVKPRLW